jgi:HTH-type transcriptional repressor of NAD biosynthesis genes
MKKGLVLGKFLPFHKGHIELINFAQENCDELTVLVCSVKDEAISGKIRFDWIADFYQTNPKVKPIHLEYDEKLLPNTSVSSEEVSRKWANYLTKNFPPFDYIFSSEKYGDFLAEFLRAKHIPFNLSKNKVPVSGTLIRQNPFQYWNYLPEIVRPYFVKKVCLVGTESTGKSTLTVKLAKHFETSFVPEMAREIIEQTIECKPEHLQQIAELHAQTIFEKTKSANKLLFVDTDINITRSYSKFLFNNELEVADWIENANKFDLYLYLKKDANFVQDGTRLVQTERDQLDKSHRQTFQEKNISFIEIGGSWEDRFNQAIKILEESFKLKK